jgi:hypothetical protein
VRARCWGRGGCGLWPAYRSWRAYCSWLRIFRRGLHRWNYARLGSALAGDPSGVEPRIIDQTVPARSRKRRAAPQLHRLRMRPARPHWLCVPHRVEIAHQAGQADRPVQAARVKFTCPLGALAAISKASSETSKVSVSSCVFSAMSVIAFGVMGISPSLGLYLIDRTSARSFPWVARVYVLLAN